MSAEANSERLSVRLMVEMPGFTLELDEVLSLTGVTAVFGPSGSGKSTLLRAIAGFARPNAGRIDCGGEPWFDDAAAIDLAAHRRPVGYMFQEPRLFTHLSVAGNLDYARRRAPAVGGNGRVPVDYGSVVEALALEPLLHRSVAGLSGGEQRRVALARTLLRAPRLLLLDEPLTGLDHDRKADILGYLEQVQSRFRLPTLYVSHDLDEVARLADSMLVLAAGRVRMHEPTATAVERLGLEPLTGRFEAGVLLEGQVAGHHQRLHLSYVDVGGDTLTLPLIDGADVGERVRLRVRAKDVAIATTRPTGLSIRNVLPGRLTEVVAGPAGSAEVVVQLAAAHLRARLTQAAVEELELAAGRDVYALIKSVSFDRGS